MRIRYSARSGSVLVTAIVIISLVGLTLVAYLSLTGSQHNLSMRSECWNEALIMGESGVEEALTQANYSGVTNPVSNGWTVSGTNVVKTRTLTDGYYTVTMSTSMPPRITSQGFVKAPLMTNSYISRTVQVTTLRTNQFKGLIAQDSVTMTGSSKVDSFDSSDPLHSTNHMYNPSNFTDNGYVGVISGAASAIQATAVYGNVATGPGGTVAVSGAGVGDKPWVTLGAGLIEPGHSRSDVNLSLTPVPVPFTNGYFTPAAGSVNGTNYTYKLTSGNYYYSGNMVVGGGQKMIVTGNAQLYTSGSFTISGSGFAVLSTNATLDLYSASTVTVSGSGIYNNTQLASSLHVYGLPTCSRVDITGGAMFVGIIYAPAAALTMSGAAGVAGCAVARTVTLSAVFHCDTSLYGSGASYVVASWNEL